VSSKLSSLNELTSGKPPKSLERINAVLACLAALVVITLTPDLRAAPQSQAPPPPPAKTQAPADSSTSQAAPPALRVVQQMVQVDIIAKDHDGKPIENLKQSDFTVYDNGRRQEI
jgi:hypothetical protein